MNALYDPQKLVGHADHIDDLGGIVELHLSVARRVLAGPYGTCEQLAYRVLFALRRFFIDQRTRRPERLHHQLPTKKVISELSLLPHADLNFLERPEDGRIVVASINSGFTVRTSTGSM